MDIKTSVRTCIFLIVSTLLTACATTPSHQLTEADLKTLALAEVEVIVPDDRKISWGRYKREQQRIQKGIPIDGSSPKKYGNTASELPKALFPTIEEHKQQMIAEPLKKMLPEFLDTIMLGDRPVRAEVTVERVYVVSAAQSFLIGGSTGLIASTRIIDNDTNSVLAILDSKTAQSGYSNGGILGVVVGEVGTLNKYEKSVQSYSRAVRNWLNPKYEKQTNKTVNQQSTLSAD